MLIEVHKIVDGVTTSVVVGEAEYVIYEAGDELPPEPVPE